jgi:hypothetical protein
MVYCFLVVSETVKRRFELYGCLFTAKNLAGLWMTFAK